MLSYMRVIPLAISQLQTWDNPTLQVAGELKLDCPKENKQAAVRSRLNYVPINHLENDNGPGTIRRRQDKLICLATRRRQDEDKESCLLISTCIPGTKLRRQCQHFTSRGDNSRLSSRWIKLFNFKYALSLHL